MMIHIVSDLHLEFCEDAGMRIIESLKSAGVDVLVVAGDLLSVKYYDTAINTFRLLCSKYPHVVYTPGNHEYYGRSPGQVDAILRECALELSNLHLLNPGKVVIDGRSFVGCTLWFEGTIDEADYRGYLNDFRLIKDFVPWVHETHERHLQFLRDTIIPNDIVVTHHLPHARSVAARFVGSPINRFFLAKDAQDLVETRGAKLWIHGHTHDPCSYSVGSTRVICAPRGYPHESKAYHGSEFVEV